MDARLSRAALHFNAGCTRYADDITFSFDHDDSSAIHGLLRLVKEIVGAEGYVVHRKKKFCIRRRHQRQVVTGLVVNRRVNLPRATRRLLRAARHRAKLGRGCTFGAEQLAGWTALEAMVAKQTRA
jgi:hypothetical protein